MRFSFTRTITVYRLASASSKESYSEYGTIKGFITPASAQDTFLTDGNPSQQFKLLADYSADVKKTDKLELNDETYIVTGIQRHDWGALRRLEATLEKFNS